MTIDIIKATSSYVHRDVVQYAIMINGAWGIGKTHFVKNEIIPSLQVDFVYLSLYGIQSIDKLESLILAELEDKDRLTQQESNVTAFKRVSAALSEKVSQVVESSYHRTDDEHLQPGVLILDDLERWGGRLEQCLSFINQLVEQQNYKCVLIGNLDEIPVQDARAFADAREKTIRHVYQFENSYDAIFKVALTLPDYASEVSGRFLRTLVRSNRFTLQQLLEKVSVKNIRTVSEAFQLYEYVFRRNSGVFKHNRYLAFAYLMALLSALILVNKYLIGKQQRNQLLDHNHSEGKGFKYLSQIGYFDKDGTDGISAEERYLLDTIFYRLDQISLKGLFSIVRNGYYVKADFDGDFDSWRKELQFDDYLDKEKFYRLEDQESRRVFTEVYASLVDQRSVTNPITILLLSERIIEDMAAGAIELNPIEFKSRIIDTVNFLYENGHMQSVEVSIFDLSGDRFVNCRGIYNHVLKHSQAYREIKLEQRVESFWGILASESGDFESLFSSFDPAIVFVYARRPEIMLTCLASLSNERLYRLVDWVDAGIGESNATAVSGISSLQTVQALIEAISQKFGNEVGIKAAQLRHLSHSLNRYYFDGELETTEADNI